MTYIDGMRSSNKTRILDAAIRVINRDGVRAVTFESVSAEAGLTRGGLLYHFPSRDALLRGIDTHLLQAWEASMEALMGKPTADSAASERHAAFMRVSAQSATRAELVFMLESMDPESETVPWGEAMERWAPGAPSADAEGALDPVALDAFVARLAADGLWIHEAIYRDKLDDRVRQAVVERLLTLAGR